MPVYERKTSDIYISSAIRNILYCFSDQCEIASLLLYKRIARELLNEDINYIDISQSDPTKISYLTGDRIKQIDQSSNEDYWTSKKRFICKPGKFAGKIFKDLEHKKIESFANLFTTFSVQKDFTFEIVSGVDIRNYYNGDNHFRNTGTLDGSCMKFDSCQGYFDIYIDNPCISMLVMLAPNKKLIGRALLWNLNDTKIMDRIYTIEDTDYLGHFTKFARENGYLHKLEQNWQNTLQFTDGKNTYEKKLEVPLLNSDYDKYPYLDTFKWLDCRKNKIYNYLPDHFEVFDENHRVISNASGEFDNSNLLAYDDYEGRYYHRNSMVVVETAKGNMFTDSENCYYSETYLKYILIDESTYSDDLRDYIYTDMSRNDKEACAARLKAIDKKNKKTILGRLFGLERNTIEQ